MRNNNQQIKTNKKNKKKFSEKNKESSENDPNRKNSEVKISHAEKDMKNLPIILDIQKIMKEKKNREQRDSVQKTTSEEKKEKCLSDMSREKNRCSSSMVYNN